jgi:hypothetical protein
MIAMEKIANILVRLASGIITQKVIKTLLYDIVHICPYFVNRGTEMRNLSFSPFSLSFFGSIFYNLCKPGANMVTVPKSGAFGGLFLEHGEWGSLTK